MGGIMQTLIGSYSTAADTSPTYIDLFWDTPKTGTLFPITLSN